MIVSIHGTPLTRMFPLSEAEGLRAVALDQEVTLGKMTRKNLVRYTAYLQSAILHMTKALKEGETGASKNE